MGMSKAEEEEQARLERARAIGLFRYMLIREAADPALSTRQRGKMVRAIAAREHADPSGRPVRLTRWTLDRWIRMWQQGGFDALVPSPRQSQPRTPPEVMELAAALKKENPARTAAQVQRILRAQGGWAPDETTIQRMFRRTGLTALTPAADAPAFGRWEASRPNEIWTGDAMHAIRLQGRKTYLFAFIDDHSRAVMAARFGFAEDAIRLAAALRPALASRGIPAHAYVVVLDIPGSLAIRPAACGNDTPRRSLTFQALTRIVRRYLAIEGDAEVCGGRWRSSRGRVGPAVTTGRAA